MFENFKNDLKIRFVKKDLQAQINSQLFYGERACFKGTGSIEFFAKLRYLSKVFKLYALDMSIKKIHLSNITF